MNALSSLKFFLPETFLLAGAFLTLILDLFLKNKKSLGVLSVFVLLGTLWLGKEQGHSSSLFFGFFVIDALTHFFRVLIPLMTLVALLLSMSYKPLSKLFEGEFYSLFLFMAFGLILMAAANNLLMIFMSVEFVSITSYLMVGLLKKDARSKEASMKYLLFGSVASALMLYGMSLLFGISGSIELNHIRSSVRMAAFYPVSFVSIILVLAGLGFKIAMVPFHMWAPDVYEAAPTPVSGFLTVAPKALGFAILIRVLSIAFDPLAIKWQEILIILSMLTMSVGNMAALGQTNIKRLIAYSSIAQAGYILMGLAVFTPMGAMSVLLYLVVYALTNLGIFTIIILVSNVTESDELVCYSGLAKRSPLAAASMVLFLLSLAGIPPLAGFIGKYFLFSSVIEKGFYSLAVVAALNSALAAYYYFKIVKTMYLTPASEENQPAIEIPLSLRLALFITLAGTVLFGVFPQPLIEFAKKFVF